MEDTRVAFWYKNKNVQRLLPNLSLFSIFIIGVWINIFLKKTLEKLWIFLPQSVENTNI